MNPTQNPILIFEEQAPEERESFKSLHTKKGAVGHVGARVQKDPPDLCKPQPLDENTVRRVNHL